MFVNSETFMKLVDKMSKLEMKCELLERKVETLEKRPITISEDNAKANEAAQQILHELMNGVVDKDIGRVKYTDGRE